MRANYRDEYARQSRATRHASSTSAATGEAGYARAERPRPQAGGPLAAIVLAAGKGTRMRSARAKVLHELLGRPMVAYPVALARALGADPVVAVLGHQREAVEAALLARFGDGAINVVEQTEQRGTGHAVRLAMPALARLADGIVLVLYGDVPLLRARDAARSWSGTARRYGCLALVTATPPDPTGYGRIVRDERGHVIGVVEQKDASPEERAIAEINAGIYCGAGRFLPRGDCWASAPSNAQGEFYLTDVVARAAREHRRLGGRGRRSRDVAGINDRAAARRGRGDAARRASTARCMAHVTFRDPASTVVEPDVEIGVDAELGPQRRAARRTAIGHGARIDDGCDPHRHRGRRRRAHQALQRRDRGR